MTLEAPDSTWLLTLGDFAGMGILPEHVLRDVAPDQLKQHPFSLNPSGDPAVPADHSAPCGASTPISTAAPIAR